MRVCCCCVAQVVADLGYLQLSNTVSWHGAEAFHPAAVLLDTAVLSLKELGAVVVADGHRGGNIIQEYDQGLQVRTAGAECCRSPATGGAVTRAVT